MGVKGWEFLILDPFKQDIQQKSQDEYTKYYKLAYNKFIQELCIPDPGVLFENSNLFTSYILCDGDNDKIQIQNENENENEKFKVVFLRSVFLKIKYKNIKSDLQMYYNTFGINVRNLYNSANHIFLTIEKKNDD
jgi:hypothetical protein